MAVSSITPRILDFPNPYDFTAVSLAECLSTLSLALDLAEGAAPGHALRTCVLGMRIAHELRLPSSQLASLFSALLLKDIGGSSLAPRFNQLIGGGDDRLFQSVLFRLDGADTGHSQATTLRLLWKTVQPGEPPLRRFSAVLRLGFSWQHHAAGLIALRCERSAALLHSLGLDHLSAEAASCLYERWDGSGLPAHRLGDETPLAGRILSVAHHLDLLATRHQAEHAIELLWRHSGARFDPMLVRVVDHLHRIGELWPAAVVRMPMQETFRAVLQLAPPEPRTLAPAALDLICEVFAGVIDAKSSFTVGHSLRVTETALRIARRLGLGEERRSLVQRAALLHNLGNLRLPNCILDKPGLLSEAESSLMREHPRITREILAHLRPFRRLAFIAGSHHERLDGSGYPDQLTAPQLPLEARILAVAVAYNAIVEPRSYHPPFDHDQAIAILGRELPRRLDPDCCDALLATHS